MARTPTRTRRRTGPGRQRGRKDTRRRLPWYRKGEILAWLAGLGAVAALVAVPMFLRGGGEGSPSQPFVGGDLHSLVADPGDADRLYVGGHEGVAVSTDGGSSWRPIDSLAGADAMGWAFTEDRVLVGGHPGLFVSEDGGRTFEQRNEGLPATDIHALGAGPGVVYAASPAAGVFASTDGGASWQMRTDQAGGSFMGRILVDPEDPGHAVAPDMEFGAVESTDGGRTWRALGGVRGAMWVSWDPADTGHIVASGMDSAAVTDDGGRTWQPLDVPRGVSVVEMSPDDPEGLYAAGLQGTTASVWVSRDAGRSWSQPT